MAVSRFLCWKRSWTNGRRKSDRSIRYTANDPALNAVFNYEKMKPFLPTLWELVNAGKKEEALRFADEYKKDPLNRYYISRMESDINDGGYRMMQSKPEVANILFDINIKLFPESANAYDSYAESFMMMGKKDEAIKYYKMVIAKDKNGETAENTRKMIDKIKSGK